MHTLRWLFVVGLAVVSFGFILPDGQPVEIIGQDVTRQAINPNPPAGPVKLIFIHHSCGENWLADYHGGLGLALRDNNYFVSDTNYGWGPDGIGDRTDIGNWWEWFQGPQRDTYLNALYTESNRFGDYYSRLPNDPGGENQIIMFKSCFPNSYLEGSPTDPPPTGDNPLRSEGSGWEAHSVANAKGIYNDILEYFATRQDKLFIAVTAPPLMEGETDTAHAANARAFNNWLVNDWLADYPYSNVAVFDFFNVLTSNGGDVYTNDAGQEIGNHHRIWNGAVQHIQTVAYNMSAYPDGDSHPTPAGNQKATAEFVPLLNDYYNRWQSVAPPAVAPTAPPAQEEPEVETTEEVEAETAEEAEAPAESDASPADEVPAVVQGLIESFDLAEYWEADSDGEGSEVTAFADDEIVYGGAGSVRIEYSIVPDGWGYYGHSFEPVQDWSDGNGLSMWLRSTDESGITLMLFAGDPQSATPFEIYIELPGDDDWQQYTFPWAAFERAAWADVGGLAEMDPTQVVGLGFSFGTEGEPIEGVLWVDELSLVTGAISTPPEEAEEAEEVEETEDVSAEPSPEPVEAAEPTAAPTEPAVSVASTQTSPPTESTASPVEEETGGGLCPLATLMGPLVLAAVVWARQR
ncbi:MAG: hypothetical protein JXM69_10540 [Anaerolineae bacterium]|nr:hypothetical protein [Anaerolineae bacterium]